MRRQLYTLLIALLFSAGPESGFSQEYLWPTDASQWMTSSFGETRPRRLHAAIDIKTWNRSGYKVFAVRDGYVSRVRVSPFGYGKAIYQKLDTGEIVVYAHLSGFNKKISAFVTRQQDKSNRYRVDRYLGAETFPVKQGDLLGYTGETGIGVPHLHFEMRDAANRPINPLTKGYHIEDEVRPILTGLMVLPLAPGSRIDGDFVPKRISYSAVEPGVYRINQSFSVEGVAGLAVAAFDRSNTVNNRFHVYEILLELDGRPAYRIRYDRFSYANNRHVELERDYRLERRRKGRYYRLFLDPANKLTFYESYVGTGGKLVALAASHPDDAGVGGTGGPLANGDTDVESADGGELAPGVHEFRIILRDYFRNTTTVEGTFVVGKRFRITPEVRQSASGLALTRIYTPTDVQPASLMIASRAAGARKGWVVEDSILTPGGVLDAVLPLPIGRRDAAGRPRDLRISMRDVHGVESWPFFLNLRAAEGTGEAGLALELDADFYDDYVRFSVDATRPLSRMPFVEIGLGDGSTLFPELFQKSQTEYVFPVELEKLTGRGVRVVVQGAGSGGATAAAELEFDNLKAPQGTRAAWTSEDGMLSIAFTPASLYRDMYGRITTIPVDELDADPSRVGAVYETGPGDVPMDRGATISIRYPDGFDKIEKLGVYYKVRNRWVFIDNAHDPAKKTISARVLSFERFALRLDEVPPEVRIRVPRAGRSVKPHTPLVAYAKDRESGFASEEVLVLKVDGRKVVAEYDPEHGTVTYRPRTGLRAGQHTIEFTAQDKSGNRSRTTRTFTVN